MLKKISNNLFYFDFPSKVILYSSLQRGVLVDAGADASIGRKVQKELDKLNIVPEVLILTHAHADHFGGAREFKKFYPKMRVLASLVEKPVFENPQYEPYLFYGAEPIPALKNKFLLGEPIRVDQVIFPNSRVTLLDEEWEILDLCGHSPGQIGLITPDQIVLTADAVFPQEVIKKYRLLYHFNLKGAIITLMNLEKLSLEGEYRLFIPTHGKPYEDVQRVIINNMQSIYENLEMVKEILREPRTREDLVAHFFDSYQIQETITQYFLTLSSISAYLSYLIEEKSVITKIRQGRLYFSTK